MGCEIPWLDPIARQIRATGTDGCAMTMIAIQGKELSETDDLLRIYLNTLFLILVLTVNNLLFDLLTNYLFIILA